MLPLSVLVLMPFHSTIRLATESDAASIQGIYAPFVRDTAISFEVEPPAIEEMQRRLKTTLIQFPWLVCEHRGAVTGYVYATEHRARSAYQWSVEVTVYISPPYQGLGIGKALYTSLFAALRLQGFYNAYAGVTLPNAVSVGLHEALGFRPVGVYEAAGYKFGKWHDTGWWQLKLQERPITPCPPLSLLEVQAHAEWLDALQTGLPFLKL